MEQSPSWEAKRSSASQEIPRILREGSLQHSQGPAIWLESLENVNLSSISNDR
jgi:hypothetical protein